MEPLELTLRINGKDFTVEVEDPNTPLLWVLRDLLALQGTRFGCGQAQCGACTVHIDGRAVRSCVTPISAVQGRQVTTIEGLSDDGTLTALQQAWVDQGVPQCGFCQAGQIMQAASLIAENPNPTDQEILDGMADNICRCGCYERIVSAVRQAATGS